MCILDKAIIYATNKHTGMVRKGTEIPFIVHPLEAVSIAAGITSDPEILAAVVLHDVVEDTTATLIEIETKFGKRVAALVASDSEDKMNNLPPSESWKFRKEATIKSLQTAAIDEKIIVLADKLSNIRAIYRDQLRLGDMLWERFNQKDKKMHEWYYRSVAESITELSESVAYQEYCRLIGDVFDK
jgi:myo-inositol-1(or 4)-monophosphatase